MRRQMRMGVFTGFAVFFAALFFSAVSAQAHSTGAGHTHEAVRVVSTTGIINDLVVNIGGSRVSAEALMGSGVDPHLYRATAGDIRTLARAEVIFHHGLHLEGKISEVLEGMNRRGVRTFAVTRDIPRGMLISAGGVYDPHVWFDPSLWAYAARAVASALSEIDPTGAETYRENARAYTERLKELDRYATEMSQTVPSSGRILITSHDAFGYFGRAYGFKVNALQGVSTVSEAAISDVRRTVGMIVRHRIPAIFTETSVSPRYMEAVKEAVESSGMSVEMGTKLYSDALGSAGTRQETFHGMFKHNVDAICISLSRGAAIEVSKLFSGLRPAAAPERNF